MKNIVRHLMVAGAVALGVAAFTTAPASAEPWHHHGWHRTYVRSAPIHYRHDAWWYRHHPHYRPYYGYRPAYPVYRGVSASYYNRGTGVSVAFPLH